MPNPQNLKPITTKKRARELGSLGGRVRSPAKSLAAKLRELKKDGKYDEQMRVLEECLTNPELSIYHIHKKVKEIETPTAGLKAMKQKLLMELHKMHHGTKLHIKSESQVNVSIEIKGLVEDAVRTVRAKRIKEEE